MPSARTGRSNDWRRARTTWIASPAAIASLAFSTARMYCVAAERGLDLAEVRRRQRRRPSGRPGRVRTRRRRRPSRRRTGAPSAPAPRRSPAPRSGSGPRGPAASVWSDAMAESWCVRWSKTMTRSVSMNAASGTPTGSRSGRGTDGSNVGDRVVAERADRAAGEAGHAVGGERPCAAGRRRGGPRAGPASPSR